jgi:hypothetical protein
MKRREMLLAGGSMAAGVAALAAVSGWPDWLREAFAEYNEVWGTRPIEPEIAPCPAGLKKNQDEPAPPKKPRILKSAADILDEGHLQALAEKKKLLVLVIPTRNKGEARYERGSAFGEYLNHGSDDDLAPLASAVVVCACVSDVAVAFGVTLSGEPLMVLVDPAANPVQAQSLDARLVPMPAGAIRGTSASPEEDRAIDDHIATIAGLVRQGLGKAPAAEVASRAGLVRQTIVTKRPPGGQWSSSMGCATSFEEGPEESETGVSCGMGHVPKRSGRFLHFLTSKQG